MAGIDTLGSDLVHSLEFDVHSFLKVNEAKRVEPRSDRDILSLGLTGDLGSHPYRFFIGHYFVKTQCVERIVLSVSDYS
jgi:hypothetical protein